MTKVDLVDSVSMQYRIGKLIKQKRRLLGLSGTALAEKAGLSKTIVSFIENETGAYSSDSVDRIRKVLNISDEELSNPEKFQFSIADAIIPALTPIQEARESLGLTPRQAAEALKIDYSMYLSYESGARNPSPKTLVKIAEFFKMDASVFERQNNSALLEICSALASSLNEKVEAIESLKLSPQALVALAEMSEESRKKIEKQIIHLFVSEAK